MKPNIAIMGTIIKFDGCFFCAQKGGKEAGGVGSEVEEWPGGCGQKGGEPDSPDGGGLML